MFVLDSDHVIVAQRGLGADAERLRKRMAAHRKSDFFLTVVTVHEQMLGANAFISRAKTRDDIVRGYRMIESAMIDYQHYQTAPFDEPAARRFEELCRQSVRIGTMDLRIASIALSHNYTLLTRNAVDFQKVPNLRFADWTS